MKKRTKEITKIFLKNKLKEIGAALLVIIILILVLFIPVFIIGIITRFTPLYDRMITLNLIRIGNVFIEIIDTGLTILSSLTIIFIIGFVFYLFFWIFIKETIFDNIKLWITLNWRKVIKQYETSIKTPPSQ